MVVKYLWGAPVGVHVCFTRHTCFDPSSRCTFASLSNHLASARSHTFWKQSATRVQRINEVNDWQILPNPPRTGPSDLRRQFWYATVCVCLLGGIYDVCLDFPFLIFDWCLQDTVSRSHSIEFILTSVKSQPEIECLIRTTQDWLYSPDPLHLKRRLKNRKSFMPMLKTSPFDWLNYDVSS